MRLHNWYRKIVSDVKLDHTTTEYTCNIKQQTKKQSFQEEVSGFKSFQKKKQKTKGKKWG